MAQESLKNFFISYILYQALGSYEQAEALLWRDLAISEKAFGPKHKGTITTIVLLIEVLYQSQGRVSDISRREHAWGESCSTCGHYC